MPSTPPAEAPARCAKKIGTKGRTQGDEIESTPARKAAIKETSTPMEQPYHRRVGAAIDRILPPVGKRRASASQPAAGHGTDYRPPARGRIRRAGIVRPGCRMDPPPGFA